MTIDRTNPRSPAYEVDAQFVDRWSPRSFDPNPLTDEQVVSLFEAARWAPSCMNEQPWLVWAARTAVARQKFLETLTERNRLWTVNAPLLLYIGARRFFKESNNVNRHSSFDTGAAWMSIALQARKLGLFAHGMAGFDRAKAHYLTNTTEESTDLFAAIAVGRRADPDLLPEAFRPREIPSIRKEIGEFVVELE
jgi:nitroreductase